MCLAQTGETAQDAYDACGKDKSRSVHYRDGARLETGSWANRVPGEGTLSLDADLQAVSYTHLDVYKRQDLAQSRSGIPKIQYKRSILWGH